MFDTSELIIDFHVHIIEYSDMNQVYRDLMVQMTNMPYEQLLERYGSPEGFLGVLDENGVDYAVVLAETSPISAGMATNERIIEYCSVSDRLIPFGSVNPYLDHRPARIVRDLAEKGGLRGLKLYPNYQYFYPNDRMLYPVYSVAEGLGIPVMFHTGTSILEGPRLKYGDPLHLDDLAVDFPDLTILQCHGGRTFWYDRAFTLCRLHENMHIDICGIALKNLLKLFPELERLPDKFIFGSDWPAIPKTMAQNIETIRNLGLKDETVRKILGGNASRILNITEKPTR